MARLTAIAPAKINLTFDILGTLPDGYHQVETLLQSIDLCDRLVFNISGRGAGSEATCARRITRPVEITCSNADLSVGEDNLIAKAAHSYRDRTNVDFDLRVQLDKQIPIGAGLAGGSADAAATLAALEKDFNGIRSDYDLEDLAAKLGTDVPFALRGGTAFGVNHGEELLPVKSKLEFTLLVVKPLTFSVSTPAAYRAFDDFKGEIKRPNTAEAVKAAEEGDMQAAIHAFGNVFEPVIFAQHPILSQIKSIMLQHGAWHAQLSGSGPALFAIVPDLEHAHFLRRKIKESISDLEFHFCQTIQKGVSITEYEHGKATC